MFTTSYGKVYTVQELRFVPRLAYDLGMGLVMSNPPDWKDVIKATMGEPTFDWAVPQAYADEWIRDNPGQPLRCIWVYDTEAPVFGRPVHLDPLLEDWKRMVLRECSDWTGT
jgi:hypothetical protein